MFQFEMGGGDFPAVVLPANQIECRHPGIVEEDRIFHARRGPPLPAGYQQFHGTDFHPWRVSGNQQPTDIFMAWLVGIGHHNCPHHLAPVQTPDINLLAVDNVFIAITHGTGLHTREIGAGIWFRQ